MARMLTSRLIDGIRAIQRVHPNDQIVMIEFEDGSGNNFNYELASERKRRFISWETIVETLGYNPDNLTSIKKS